MKRLKTSSRISRSFTITVTLLVFLFGFLVNGFFFRSWYSHETKGLQNFKDPVETRRNNNNANPLQFKRTIVMSQADMEQRDFEESRLFSDVLKHNDKRLLARYFPARNQYLITDITPLIERQYSLLILTLLLIVVTSILSFIASRWFVRRALRDVYTIAEHVESLNIDDLITPLHLDHLPVDDELRTITLALNDMTQSLHAQINDIKRFVGNVSHEFKTPLMVMRSHAELALKSKKYKQGLVSSIERIDQLNRLVETLLSLASSQHHTIQSTEVIDVTTLLHTISDQVQENYSEKNIVFAQILPDHATLHSHRGSLEIIIRNLLDNAFKYTPAGGSIIMSLEKDILTIHDSGPGISHDDQQHMREAFWQGDQSKGVDQGFGLGLPLVKSLCDQLGYTIRVASSPGTGTSFSIYFTG